MRRLKLTNDIVFKVLFASNTEESHIALTGLLEAILERPIESLKIINGEITNKNQLSKKTQFDIAVRFQDGELVDLEMQAFPQLDDLGARALFYGSRLLQSQDVKGKSYSCLVNSYVILLLDYCLLKDEEIIHVFRMKMIKEKFCPME